MLKHTLFFVSSVLLCFPSFAQWTKKADKKNLCGDQSLNAVALGSYCYIGAGYSASCPDWYKYDPASDQWSSLAPYPSDYNGGSSGFAIGGKIYVGIGSSNNFSPSRCDNKLYVYDPAVNTWTYKTTMPGPKRQGCSYFVIGNYAYIGMGADSVYSTKYKDFYKYDPVSNSWSAIAVFPDTAVIGSMSFAANGKGYVVGGTRIQNTVSLNSFGRRYDPASNSWQAIKQVPVTKFFRASAAVVNDVPYICMGLGAQPGNVGSQELYSYNSASDNWVYIDTLPDRRTWDEGIGFSVNNKAYFGLGDYNQNAAGGIGTNGMMWEYSPSSTSVNDLKMQGSLVISPIPAKGYFTVTSPDQRFAGHLELYNLLGKRVMVWDHIANSTPVRYDGIQPGTYFLNIISSNGNRQVTKIVLQ